MRENTADKRSSARPYLFGLFALLVVVAGYFLLFPAEGPKTLPAKTSPGNVAAPAAEMPEPEWDAFVLSKAFKKQFRLKRSTDLLGLHILYLESKRIPQQVIIAENVPPTSSAILFSSKPDLTLMTMVSNQLLALRKKKNAQQLTVEQVDTVSMAPLHLEHHTFPHRQVKVRIKLGTEKKPRYYTASIVRYASPLGAVQDQDASSTVLVSFAKPEAFKESALLDLLALHPSFKAAPESVGVKSPIKAASGQ